MNERDYHDQHYESEAAEIEGTPLFERVHARSAQDFLRASGVGRNHRVLSLGCGDGSIERRLAPHVGEIVGIDISPVAVAHARKAAEAAGVRNVSFEALDAGGLKLERFGRFDAVAAFAFLHHIPEQAIDATLAEARKALTADGAFYSSDPSRRRLVGLFTSLVRKTYDRYHSPDERELDPAELAASAARSGFGRVQIRYVDYFLGPLAWLAPGTPRWLAPPLAALDSVALALPLVSRYASSFSVLARP